MRWSQVDECLPLRGKWLLGLALGLSVGSHLVILAMFLPVVPVYDDCCTYYVGGRKLLREPIKASPVYRHLISLAR